MFYFFSEMTAIKVKPRNRVTLTFEVAEANSFLVWKFKSDGHDVSFGILFEDDEEILPVTRVDAHKELQKGEIICKKIGKYKFVFDNCYSHLREKIVHYQIENIHFPQDGKVDVGHLGS